MMEPQEEFCGCKKSKKKTCLGIVLFILVVVLALVVGLVLGTIYVETITSAFSALIVFIAVMVLLVIINAILFLCDEKKCNYCN